MVRVVARRDKGYAHEVEIEGGHTLLIDEPPASGGADEGPSPTRVLAASLAACTAITLEMYADRKEWDVGDVEVEVEMDFTGAVPTDFTVTLRLPKTLSAEQQERIRVIAGKCPVHRALVADSGVSIRERIELV
jgi:putative redox protein